MPLRYNDATGEFEETGRPEPPASDSLRYNPETGEFEPIRGRGTSRRRSAGPRTSPGSPPRSGQPRPRPSSAQAQFRPEPEPRQWPTTEQFAQSVRRAQRREQKRHQVVLRRLCWIGLALAVIAFLLGGKEIAVTSLGIVFLLWIAYGICSGAVWPWLVLGAIAAIYFLPTWLCIVIAVLVGLFFVP